MPAMVFIAKSSVSLLFGDQVRAKLNLADRATILARAEGLKAIPKPVGGLTADNVVAWLKTYGARTWCGRV